MGLIHAIAGAAGGVLADSWRDFFYCDALNENVLAVKGQKRTSDQGRSSNIRGESNIISDGSIIAVNDGQCMIIVESGEIVDVCAEPGQFVYDRSTEPSIFYGDLGEGIRATFERIGQRFTFGGDTGKDQRIYYFNTKEIIGNKYGTSSPIPFRIVDANLGLDMDTTVRMNGEYSFRLVDPLVFYKKVCGNVEEPYTRDRLESQMKSELLTALQPALARISELGVRYSAIPAHTKELAGFLNEELTNEWFEQRGIKVEKFGINSITLPEDVEERIAARQMAQTMVDPNQAAAVTANAAADAMRDAAKTIIATEVLPSKSEDLEKLQALIKNVDDYHSALAVASSGSHCTSESELNSLNHKIKSFNRAPLNNCKSLMSALKAAPGKAKANIARIAKEKEAAAAKEAQRKKDAAEKAEKAKQEKVENEVKNNDDEYDF